MAFFRVCSTFVKSGSPLSIIPSRSFLTTKKMSSEKFEAALKKLSSLQADLGNDEKLKLYALYKQATEGECRSPKPSMMDFVGKAKWDAWKSLGSMQKDDAKSKYVEFVDTISGDCAGEKSVSDEQKDVMYSIENGIAVITLNRPAKKNAITTKMYTDLVSALKRSEENDTAITVITGTGSYYSSGNDLSNFTVGGNSDLATAAKSAGSLLQEFVAAFIDFRKVLVAAVNGPAVGIPVTLLGLCDVAYASDKATFYTPFSLLGQSPEACSSYLFPKIMGYSKANEILLFNKKFNAQEAKDIGLISEVFPNDTFMEDVRKRLSALSSASAQSMIYSKELTRRLEKETLHKVNAMECERLVERWQSPDCMNALMNFFQRKSNL